MAFYARMSGGREVDTTKLLLRVPFMLYYYLIQINKTNEEEVILGTVGFSDDTLLSRN